MLGIIQAVLDPTIFRAMLMAELEAWEIGIVAFAFVGVILVISYLIEKWGVGLHA